MILFHYTDCYGYHAIQRERAIRPSNTRTHYGPGVYLTDLDPDQCDKEDIAQRIYWGGAEKNVRQGRLDYHIMIEVPDDDVRFRMERKNVYRYATTKGYGLLNLEEFEVVSIGDRSKWDGTKAALGTIGKAATGAVAALALASFAAEVYNHSNTGRQSRTLKLYNELENILSLDPSFKLSMKVCMTKDCSCFFVCQVCHEKISKEYTGGYLFSDIIDKEQLTFDLWLHVTSHALRRLFPFALLTFGGIVGAWSFLKKS